jgi:hypothetical protein
MDMASNSEIAVISGGIVHGQRAVNYAVRADFTSEGAEQPFRIAWLVNLPIDHLDPTHIAECSKRPKLWYVE